MRPYYEKDGIIIYCGDSLKIGPQLEPNSIDGIITDTPYNLTSMTKPRKDLDDYDNGKGNPYARRQAQMKGFMGKAWDGSGIAFKPELWANFHTPLKPGAFIFAFGGTRTYHRLACAVEDAGYEIRDSIRYLYDAKPQMETFLQSLNESQLKMYLDLYHPADELSWAYGSGFPKSLSIGKAIDKQEQNKWLDIAKAIDSLDKNSIITVWKKYLNTVNNVDVTSHTANEKAKRHTPTGGTVLQNAVTSGLPEKPQRSTRKELNNVSNAAKILKKNITETGMNTQKSGFAQEGVTLKINRENKYANVIIAELGCLDRHPISGTQEIIAQEIAEQNTTQLQQNVKSAERLPQSQKAMFTNTFIAQCDVKELLNEKAAEIIKADEALMIWLGKMKSLNGADTNALCVVLTENLKRIILNQSKTFQSLDTKSQMECVSATNVTITESTAAHLITFTADTLKSKSIDKAAGVEREVVGRYTRPDGSNPRDNVIAKPIWGNAKDGNDSFITAPATDAAKLWDGFGSALKPSYEPILYFTKPLTVVTFDSIIQETNNLIGVMLCLLLSSVNDAEKVFQLSPAEPTPPDFAAMLVALLNGQQSGALLEKMDTFNSPEAVKTCLNTANLWNNLLAEILNIGSKFTTKMETEVTMNLKILKSLLSANIPDYITRGAYSVNGQQSSVTIAEKNLSGESQNTSDTLTLIVAELVSWNASVNGTPANNAANNLQQIIPSVNSVLQNVTASIVQSHSGKESKETAHTAGQSLKQSHQGPQSIATPNVWQMDTKKISPDYLPIIVAMKPLDGTYAQNALKWGVAGLNIDAGRVGTEDTLSFGSRELGDGIKYGKCKPTTEGIQNPAGRWPANIITDGSDEVTAGFPETGASKAANRGNHSDIRGDNYNRSGGKTIPNSDSERGHNDSGGSASRFFYTAKADKKQRIYGWQYLKRTRNPRKLYQQNIARRWSKRAKKFMGSHPTVKPMSLMDYLIKLTTMPGNGPVLDPFMGSGKTLLAARKAGRPAIGIDLNPEYCEIAIAQIKAFDAGEPLEDEIEYIPTNGKGEQLVQSNFLA